MHRNDDYMRRALMARPGVLALLALLREYNDAVARVTALYDELDSALQARSDAADRLDAVVRPGR